eukprot:scaffold390_cov115-Isochrysis_galbana.AAC.3
MGYRYRGEGEAQGQSAREQKGANRNRTTQRRAAPTRGLALPGISYLHLPPGVACSGIYMGYVASGGRFEKEKAHVFFA